MTTPKRRHPLVVKRQYHFCGLEPVVSLSELARTCGCHPDLVLRLTRHGLLETVDESEDGIFFRRSSIRRLWRALRLRNDLGLNANTLAVVVELLERIDDLEAELARFKSRLEE